LQIGLYRATKMECIKLINSLEVFKTVTIWVYHFGSSDHNTMTKNHVTDAAVLGGKGASLAAMSSLGLPVPLGFTIQTAASRYFLELNFTMPPGLYEQVNTALEDMSQLTERCYGSINRPLFLSVRSGAQVSMPGMLDTILNLGMNIETTAAFAHETGDVRFAYDSYRRFIQMYSDVVLNLDHVFFEDLLDIERKKRGLTHDGDFSSEDLQEIVHIFLNSIEKELGQPFPQDPQVQLWEAIASVFKSWNSPRAQTYRKLHNIPDDWGTALTIQSMVFGNSGTESVTGVVFTRDPSTGEKGLYGEFLPNAQGEDIVAGLRNPHSLSEKGRLAVGSVEPSFETSMPAIYAQLSHFAAQLELHFTDMQDIEFTVENGTLWLLQTRAGKRTLRASLVIAVDMANEGIISRKQALMRIEPAALDQILHPCVDPSASRTIIGIGLPASPGAATGEIVFSSEEAEKLQSEGRHAILVRAETSPQDVHGMHAAQGVLTTRGGMTSHAAVVARGMGKPCVTGAGSIKVDTKNGVLICADMRLRRGDIITIDGGSGHVLKGAVPTLQPELSGEFVTIMNWADEVRRMKVWANADTPQDAIAARAFGAQGIGLCRTEQMFFDEIGITDMREMILAETEKERRAALSRLLPVQRANFIQLFEIMAGMPVTIRLLDPPLHEFLPKGFAEMVEVATSMDLSHEVLRERMEALHEFNPMLGHRGCRLVISFPEIVEMQARAIFEAAIEAQKRIQAPVVPEIMIPLVSMMKELTFVIERISYVANQVFQETGIKIDYHVGAVIELPRAAMRAGVIASECAFFSFGTNDLTQTTYGISRDDASAFFSTYMRKKIMERDPFMTIDRDGVGEIIKMGCERGRAVKPHLMLGVCGEHGGDPQSIDFFEEIGMDFISCSPFRVPIARLAAAQSTIKFELGLLK
jgi:pyruvate, orthophosphate dikinase